jgi:hypothetical protein
VNTESCHRPNYWKYKQNQSGALSTGVKGGINELRACTYLLSLGYEVFRNVCASGKGDLVAWKHGEQPIIIDVKSICTTVYQCKDGTERVSIQMTRSKYPGVVTLGVFEDGSVICDALPKN